MSTTKKIAKSAERQKQNTALIGASIIMIIVIGIGIGSYYFGRHDATSNNSVVPIINISQANAERVLGASTERSDETWQGTIQAIDNNSITVSIDPSSGLTKSQPTSLIARISDSTQLWKWDITKKITPENPQNKERITIDQFQNGQTVLVKSLDRPDADDAVNALSINVLITS